MSEPVVFVSPESDIQVEKTVDAAPKPKPPIRNSETARIRVPKPPHIKPRPNSNKYTERAKELVVDNYNAHHDSSKTPPLTSELVYVAWFSKVVDNWKAIVGSTVLQGLLYEVTYRANRAEATIDVYKKINTTKIAD